MGLITWFLGKLLYPVLFTGSSTYWAFKLGSELPVASRKAGHWIGMQYNYFKVTLRFFSPDATQANAIISDFRRGSQQAHAFTREVKTSILLQKETLEQMVPELGIDPLKEFNQMLELENNPELKAKKQNKGDHKSNGAQEMLEIEEQRRSYIRTKLKKRKEEEHYLKY